EAVTRYAWFKDDANNELPTINYPATITYIRDTTDLIARAIPTISVPTWGDAQPADIRAHNINDDSSATIGIHKLEISVTPNLDLATNDQSRVLIRDTGSFSLTLTAIDNAGNSDTDTCALTVVNGATGLTTVWTGNGDGNDWHDNDNWSNYAPSPDATAWITNSGAAVTLKSSSPLLHSLVISNNATLTFKNWQTKLTATTMTIGHKGKLSCIGPFRNNEMSNRVWVAAHNFTLASGGTIDLVGKGYAGGLPFEDGHGPGGGKTGGTGAAAASHGGLGGIGYSKEKNGPLYGNAREPLAPGSGGGGGGASNGFGPGSDGGGAVLIEASGSVVIDGAIMANATHVAASTRGGGASGGSVYIVCSTFSGADGTISASGGNAPFWGGGGGGGRIAIVPTNMIAQATLPPHRVTFAAHRGLCTQARARDGALGSLYLPGTALIDGPFMPHTGVIDIPDWESWSVDSLAVSGWLQISNSTPFFELEVAHDFTIDGANAHWELQWPRITVGGNMVITNGGQLSLACAVSNAVTHAAYGALIDVAHNLTIAAGAWLRPQSAGFDGNSLHICASNLYVLASGGINADNLGFMYGYNAAGYDPHGYGPGHGYAAGSSGSGAGYGGRGGRSAYTELRGDIYGSDILPDLPGSGGGAHLLGVNSRGGSGGGFIWINVQDKALIDGSLTANGQKGIRNGGGSGGAIHLHCRDFSGGLSGILSAKGGDTYDTTYNGGGGGGRIAIWSGQPYFPAISKSRLVISEVAPDSFSGTVSVKEGLSYPSETHYSEPGTIRFIHVKHPAGTMVLVR
ncbi:MAG: hypothetical protein GX230_01740, partial [Lentisphaerae bacterium]|nr:hypothetical protein [Lentisphaerota bacterium]